MANEVIVPVKVETKDAISNVESLGKSFNNLDKNVAKTQERQTDYGKQILQSSQLSQKLSQATGGLSDAFVNAVKGIDMTKLSLKGMKTAIASTGVGLLVIALGELITMMADFFSSEKKSEKAVNDLTKALDDQSDAFDELSETAKFQLDLTQKYAKANGASKEEMKKTNDRYLASEKKRIAEMLRLLELEHQAVLENDDLSDEDREKAIEKVNANIKKLQGLKVKNVRDTLNADAEFYAQQQEAQKQATDKANSVAQQNRDKAKADLQQQQTALKNLEKKYEDDIENMKDTTAQQKLNRQKERALEELNNIKLSETEKAKAIQLINQDFKLKQEALDKVQDDKLLELSKKFIKDKEDLLAKTEEEKLALKIQRDKEALEIELATMVGDDQAKANLRKQLDDNNAILTQELAQKRLDEQNTLKQAQLIKDSENEKLTFEARLLALKEQDRLIDENTALTAQQRLEAHQKNKEAVDKVNKDEVASEKAKQEAKKQLAQLGIDILKTASSIIFGEGKKAQQIQKALTLTQIGIDTASAFSKLMAGSEASAVGTGPAYAFSKPIFYASGVLQILSNVAKAKQALSSSDSGGGSVSASGGGGGGAIAVPPAPTFNVVGPSGTNQIAQSIAGQDQQPIKAYVVGGDVTTQQGLNRNIVNNASIG
jgi:hypothetical protein